MTDKRAKPISMWNGFALFLSTITKQGKRQGNLQGYLRSVFAIEKAYSLEKKTKEGGT